MSAPIAPAADLRASLDRLAERVDAVAFDAPSDRQRERRDLRDGVSWSIHEYLIPRLGDIAAPSRVVVVGSTGSGKSTIVNSLAQLRVSEPGALRPTTRLPVLWCHERHEADYTFGFLSGYGTTSADERALKLVAGTDALLDGVSLLDAPDFDSVEESHHEMAEQLLAIADVCIFVTSAQRYADAVPWEFLDKAQRRGIPVIHVMNRMPPGGEAAAVDYRRRLREGGIPVNLFMTIDEQPIDPVHGGLPPEAVERIRKRLEILADEETRARLVMDTTRSTLADVLERTDVVITEVRGERDELGALLDIAERSYADQRDEIAEELDRGSLIRGQVVARWQEFLGTGELMKALSEGAAKVRDWISRVWGGPRPIERVEVEVRGELETIVSRRAGRAAGTTAGAWDLDPIGARLLEERSYQMWHEDDATPERARAAVDDWIAELARLVESEGEGRRRLAQVASTGVNAVAVSATVAIFAHTGGVTGAELGVAAGAAAVQQKLLEHVFGSAAARSLIAEGRRSLIEAIGRVLDQDRARFEEAVAPLMPPEDLEAALTAAGERVIERGAGFYET